MWYMHWMAIPQRRCWTPSIGSVNERVALENYQILFWYTIFHNEEECWASKICYEPYIGLYDIQKWKDLQITTMYIVIRCELHYIINII